MSKWIWKFGEFEHYHNLLLHNRRVQYGYAEPPVWKLYSVDTVVRFQKTVDTQGGIFKIEAKGIHSVTVGSDYKSMKKYGGQKEICLEPGKVQVSITVSKPAGLPALYVSGVISSDESWLADDLTGDFQPVGTWDYFDCPEKNPEEFPFSYTSLSCKVVQQLDGGQLLDFGRESFAALKIFTQAKDEILIRLGESKEEAMDPKWCVIQYRLKAENGEINIPASAFRYIYISEKQARVQADYQYLPLEYRGSFRCDEELINKIWDTAAYTFHLNSREFFLDGIKRDRWVWSGDAYQSIFVNRYLFFDKEIEKRTLIALGGKAPFLSHINTIMDYSFFWIISLYEYYRTYGDIGFIRQMYPQLKAVMDFCRSRADEDGFVRGKKGDWIFIDWAPMDKTGALCGEQVLYAKALSVYGEISALLNVDDGCAAKLAEELNSKIVELFFNREKMAFVDSWESGKNTVTRQSNLLAYLFLPISAEMKDAIYQNVVLNQAVPQITTPYFKFYENEVHCRHGNQKLLEESMRNYYGAMLSTGATSLYEEFDPNMRGAEHYAMYGNPYEKSLCHAWSASPIYLLGRYRMGVVNTGIAYSSFEVQPSLGDLKEFWGKVPLPHGEVELSLNNSELCVSATQEGGTLYYKGREIPLVPGVPCKISQ